MASIWDAGGEELWELAYFQGQFAGTAGDGAGGGPLLPGSEPGLSGLIGD